MDEIKKKYEVYCTVGELLEFIEKNNIPKDAKILAQRIEDFYFTDRVWHDGSKLHAWETVKKCGDFCGQALDHNKKVDDGVYLDKEQYPDMDDVSMKKYSEDDLEEFKDEYLVCFCPVKYPDDDNLYLNIHY